jgi:antitoxin component HigA of HigAB toxin-antitoxin module
MKYFELDPLQSDDELMDALEVVELLIDMEPLDRAEGAYLDKLSDLVCEYEEHHYPMLGAEDVDYEDYNRTNQ